MIRNLVYAAAAVALSAVAAEVSFDDVSETTGVRDALRGAMAHAAAWGDFDDDGDLDLFVGMFADRKPEVYQKGGAPGPVPNRMLRHDGDRFVVAEVGTTWLGRASGAVFADFDNDGDLDLYVANNGRLGKENLMYRNDGGTFTALTEGDAAILQQPEVARCAGVLDFDGDGLLDLLVLSTAGKGPTLLFHNLGGMRFERSDAIPGDVYGLGLATGDLTGNGWPDILVGGSNRLFVNRGNGTFREATEAGIDWGFEAEDRAASCGIAFGDFDRDGRLDILIGSHLKSPWFEPNSLRLLHNEGSTVDRVVLREVTEEVGLKKIPIRLPHVEIRDFNNDGWPDLYSSAAVFKDGRVYPHIYLSNGAVDGALPTFTETAFVHRPDYPGPDDVQPKESTTIFFDRMVAKERIMYYAPGPSADFDNDGRLDIFFPSWFSESPSRLLRNTTVGGGWLNVRVRGSKGINPMGVGAMVQAWQPGKIDIAGGRLASEQIATAYGYCSAQPAVAHLGLGAAARVDITVELPCGRGRIVRRDVEANQTLIIETP